MASDITFTVDGPLVRRKSCAEEKSANNENAITRNSFLI